MNVRVRCAICGTEALTTDIDPLIIAPGQWLCGSCVYDLDPPADDTQKET